MFIISLRRISYEISILKFFHIKIIVKKEAGFMESNYLIQTILMECPLCDKKHNIEKRKRISTITIKGEPVEYEETYYLCKNSDEEENEFVPSKINDLNLKNARNAYRIKKDLLTSEEIKEIREQYGLSQSDLSNLLGWGEVTISRYESKSIQDEAHDNILKTIKDNPMQLYEYLKKNGRKFTPSKYVEIRERINKNLNEYGKEYLKRQILLSEYLNYFEPSDFNGNTTLDIDKLESIISYFAKKVNNLYKVKLMKMLWYADSLSYKLNERAMTGLVYTHEPMGALPKGHYKILELENINVSREEDFENTKYHILPNNKLNLSNLSSNDLDILDQIIQKFKYFTSDKIINYMHNEKAYLETQTGQEIPFSLAKEIKDF